MKAAPTPTLLAYTGSQYTKAQAVALMQEHRRLDHLMQGVYTRGHGASFKGCMVGCAAGGKHDLFAPLFGIPPILAHLADALFERLTLEGGKNFAVDFFQVIPSGANLSRVYPAFAASLLEDALKTLPADHKVTRAITGIYALFKKLASGFEVAAPEWALALALALDLDLALALDRARARARALDLARALALARALDLALDLALALDLDLDLDLARALADRLLTLLSQTESAP